jgi:hypothetical protein
MYHVDIIQMHTYVPTYLHTWVSIVGLHICGQA